MLKIAVNRREVKSKGEKEMYTHLNAEFQRIARMYDKKAFLSDQCKQIEENDTMGKSRDLFKKIRDTKGTFHARVGIKWYEPNRQKRLRRGGRNIQNYTKMVLRIGMSRMVWSLT